MKVEYNKETRTFGLKEDNKYEKKVDNILKFDRKKAFDLFSRFPNEAQWNILPSELSRCVGKHFKLPMKINDLLAYKLINNDTENYDYIMSQVSRDNYDNQIELGNMIEGYKYKEFYIFEIEEHLFIAFKIL